MGELPIVGREVAALVLLARHYVGTLNPQILDLITERFFAKTHGAIHGTL